MSRRRVLVVLGSVVSVVVVGVLAFSLYYELTLYRAGPAQRGDLALVGATVLAGDNLEPIPGGVVLVRDGMIIDVGTPDSVELPSTATVVDLTDYVLLPGLIDLHVHLGSPALDAHQEPGYTDLPGTVLDAVRMAPAHRRSALEHGVTSVRNLGDEHDWIIDLRNQIDDGTLEGPRVFASGPLFTTAGGHPVVTFGVDPGSDGVRLPTTPDEGRAMVRALATGDDRVDVIKIVQDRGDAERPLEPIVPEVLRAIIAEAHDHGLRATAHWGAFQDLRELLDAGIDGLEHLESRDLLDGWSAPLLHELVERQIPVAATLVVSEAALPPDEMPAALDALQQRAGELHTAGGRIVVGSDAGRPGVPFGASVHRELELLVGSGMSPHEALRAATVHAARVLGTDRIGVISPGRAADLVVIEGDPIANIEAIRNVVMTLRDGRIVFDLREDR